MAMFNHILVPSDGSPLSIVALEKSLDFAREIGARVTVMTVVEPFRTFSLDPDEVEATRDEYERHARAGAAASLSEAQRKALAVGVPCSVAQVQHSNPYEAIIKAAEERECDLIAMASHGRRGVAALLLGSETVKVLTHSTIPVLVFR
jgi:nucleotide-binding universal stress UspA family protein